MRIVMIGGTGFLGYFTTRELVARGHEAVAVGLAQPEPGSMADGVEVAVLDANTCGDEELAGLLEGCDVLIHAAGADGRDAFAAPALDGFRAANVEPMRRLIGAGKRAGVGHLVIFGSYYTALDRLLPHLAIAEGNAYPKSRKEQAELAFALAGQAMNVSVLELPYIFGGAPGRGTLWRFYIDHVLDNAPQVPVPSGGSACVTARQVAWAAVGACERSQGHRHYPLAGENLSYRDIYGHFAAALGVERTFSEKSSAAAVEAARMQKQKLRELGRETGYDPVAVAQWQDQFLYLDPAPAMEALAFGHDDIAEAIAETVAATLAHGGQGPASLLTTSKGA